MTSAPVSHRSAWRRAAVVVVTALSVCAAASAQQSSFRAGVDLVTLDVTVLDSRRQPVRGLTAGNFRVTVEGRDVPIASFVAVDRGEHAGAASTNRPTTAPDVALPSSAADAGDTGRLVILMFDRSIPTGEPTNRARAIARAVVESAGADDDVAVVRSSGFGNEGASVELTRDRERLLAAIETPFTGLVTPPDMTFLGLQSAPPDLFLTGDCRCGMCVFDTLENVARAIERESRQKVLFFIGSDIIIQPRPTDPVQCQQPVRDGRARVLRAIDAANLTVHAFDTLGIQTLTSGADTLPTGNRGRPPMSRHLERQGNLAVLPDFTGGRTVLNTNTPEAAVPGVLAETSSYYVIGIERGPVIGSREQRAVRVRVDRRGVTVRARSGYYGA